LMINVLSAKWVLVASIRLFLMQKMQSVQYVKVKYTEHSQMS